MDKHYTYLLINFFTVLFPVLLSFDKKVKFSSNWKNVLPGLLITGVLFLIWDYLFTIYNVWRFNSDYVVGIYLLNLPLEEILFFITVPFACLFIYECLNCYVRKDLLKSSATAISVVLVILSAVMVFFYYQRVYTLITFSLLLLMSGWLILKRPAYLSRFYLAFLVSLVPFYLVNGILTSVPVVLYNDAQNCGVRLGTIPLEDHFYSLSMLMLNVVFFEYFKGRKESA